jgi:hypothetical protein
MDTTATVTDTTSINRHHRHSPCNFAYRRHLGQGALIARSLTSLLVNAVQTGDGPETMETFKVEHPTPTQRNIIHLLIPATSSRRRTFPYTAEDEQAVSPQLINYSHLAQAILVGCVPEGFGSLGELTQSWIGRCCQGQRQRRQASSTQVRRS